MKLWNILLPSISGWHRKFLDPYIICESSQKCKEDLTLFDMTVNSKGFFSEHDTTSFFNITYGYYSVRIYENNVTWMAACITTNV